MWRSFCCIGGGAGTARGETDGDFVANGERAGWKLGDNALPAWWCIEELPIDIPGWAPIGDLKRRFFVSTVYFFYFFKRCLLWFHRTCSFKGLGFSYLVFRSTDWLIKFEWGPNRWPDAKVWRPPPLFEFTPTPKLLGWKCWWFLKYQIITQVKKYFVNHA